jgi:hypothetical protein
MAILTEEAQKKNAEPKKMNLLDAPQERFDQ